MNKLLLSSFSFFLGCAVCWVFKPLYRIEVKCSGCGAWSKKEFEREKFLAEHNRRK